MLQREKIPSYTISILSQFELRRREGSVQNHSKITVRSYVRLSPSNCMWGFDLNGIVLGFLSVFFNENGFLRGKIFKFQLKRVYVFCLQNMYEGHSFRISSNLVIVM